MTMTMPAVEACDVKGCAFNHDGCSAYAMTMGQFGCATLIQLDVNGGLDKVTAQVGACQKADCAHNDHLECHADHVRISGANGSCMTYEKA